MDDDAMNSAEKRQFADRIIELRDARAAERRSRHRARWEAVSDFLFSIPPGIGVRLGG